MSDALLLRKVSPALKLNSDLSVGEIFKTKRMSGAWGGGGGGVGEVGRLVDFFPIPVFDYP